MSGHVVQLSHMLLLMVLLLDLLLPVEPLLLQPCCIVVGEMLPFAACVVAGRLFITSCRLNGCVMKPSPTQEAAAPSMVWQAVAVTVGSCACTAGVLMGCSAVEEAT
jgi:hypothetical protein